MGLDLELAHRFETTCAVEIQYQKAITLAGYHRPGGRMELTLPVEHLLDVCRSRLERLPFDDGLFAPVERYYGSAHEQGGPDLAGKESPTGRMAAFPDLIVIAKDFFGSGRLTEVKINFLP
jgi:hypothetical protein